VPKISKKIRFFYVLNNVSKTDTVQFLNRFSFL